MKPVHILGWGFVIGMLALGAMVAATAYRWQVSAFPESAQALVSKPGESASPQVAQGRTLFQQKCSSCHTIGKGRLSGPDLNAITAQRPRDWLIEFIVAPDQVLARGDPTAAELVKEYGMPMPNVGVTREQAEQVLAYIDSQTSGGAPAPPSAAQAAPDSAVASPPSGPGLALATHGISAAIAVSAPSAAAAAPPGGPAPAPAAAPAPAGAAAQVSPQAKALYDQKCAGCHSIGGGKLAGPDLKGVSARRPRDWLIQTIVAPDRLIAGGDPTARQLAQEYGMPMPNVGVSTEQAEQLLTYIDAQSGGAAAPAGATAAQPLPQGDPAAGRALFSGERRFARGGPACAACHNVAGLGAGGNWGVDLTRVHSKIGAPGLVSLMRSPAFPGMKEAYEARALTDGEVADLAALFAEIDARQPGTAMDLAFPLIGLVALVILAGLSALAWRHRTPPVRKSLVGR